MDNIVWLLIGIIILAAAGIAIYKNRTGKLPSQIDRDGDNKLF